MPVCLNCGTTAPAGALFCAKCGRTVPQAETAIITPTAPGVYLVTPAPMSRPTAIPPPPQWIPRELVGRAVHCPRCNTLISPVAIVCPVCQAQLSASGGAAAGAEPPQ